MIARSGVTGVVTGATDRGDSRREGSPNRTVVSFEDEFEKGI